MGIMALSEPVHSETEDGSERGLMDSLIPIRIKHRAGGLALRIGSRPRKRY